MFPIIAPEILEQIRQRSLAQNNALPASPVIPPVATSSPAMIPPTTSPVAPIRPTLNPSNFAPVPELPEQAKLREAVANPPQAANYQAHGLRRVLNGIAGGLAGAAGHPEAGQVLADLPYTQAMRDYNTRVKAAQTVSDLAAGRQTEGVRTGTALAGATTREEAAETARLRAGIAQQDSDTKKAEENRKVAADKVKAARSQILNDYTSWKMKPENVHKSDMQYLYEKLDAAQSDEDHQAILEQIKELKQAGRPSLDQLTAESKAKAMGGIQANLTPEGRQAAAVKPAAAETAKLTAEANDPNIKGAVDALYARSVADPDSAQDNIDKAPTPLAKAMLVSQLKDVDYAHRITDVTVKTAVNNAKTALLHVGAIEDLAKDPEVQVDMGPLAGRIAKVASKIGLDTNKNLTEDQRKQAEQQIISEAGQGIKSDKTQAMLGLLAYLVTFEASSISGTRPSHQLIDYIKSVSGDVRMDPKRFAGALESTKTAANLRLKAAFAPSDKGGPKVNPPSKPSDKPDQPQFQIDWSNLKKK